MRHQVGAVPLLDSLEEAQVWDDNRWWAREAGRTVNEHFLLSLDVEQTINVLRSYEETWTVLTKVTVIDGEPVALNLVRLVQILDMLPVDLSLLHFFIVLEIYNSCNSSILQFEDILFCFRVGADD